MLKEPEALSTKATAMPPTSEGCPDNLGRIIFSYDPKDLDSVHYGIYLMDPDGGNRVRVSSPDEKHAMEPSWSPDRCQIAYKSFTNDGGDDIYVITADGQVVRRLTTDPAFDVSPKWSPDGKQISFFSKRDGTFNLFIMDADGSNQRQVTSFKNNEMASWQSWSPRGDEIVFTYDSTEDEFAHLIYAIRPDGSGLREVVEGSKGDSDWEPVWSPDGNKIYFISNRAADLDIWEINSDGSGLRQVSDWGDAYEYTHSLRISPDGRQLAFYGIGPDIAKHSQEIFVINVDGSGFKNISQSSGQEEWLDW